MNPDDMRRLQQQRLATRRRNQRLQRWGVISKSGKASEEQTNPTSAEEFTEDEKKALLVQGVKTNTLSELNETIKNDLELVSIHDSGSSAYHPFAKAFNIEVEENRVENFNELNLDEVKRIVDEETSKEEIEILIHNGYNAQSISSVERYSPLRKFLTSEEQRGIQVSEDGHEFVLAKVTKKTTSLKLHPVEYTRRLVQSNYKEEVHWSFVGYVDYYYESGYYDSTTRHMWKIKVYSDHAIAKLISSGRG